MRKAHTPYRWEHWVHRAEGDGQVERALIGPVQGGVLETVVVDTICLGYGFTPSIQLARQAGCQHRYDPEQRVYLPVREARWRYEGQGHLVWVHISPQGVGRSLLLELE